MRFAVTLLVALTLSWSSFNSHAETGEFFIRSPFGDQPEAGYRWAGGWSVSGRVGYRYDELALGDSSALDVRGVLGKRTTFDSAENWRTFWDIDVGAGFVELEGERLNNFELGAYLGAEVLLATRLKLAGRIGTAYTRTERSVWATRDDIQFARAQIELAYSW